MYINGKTWDNLPIPSGNCLQFAIENCHRNNGFTHGKKHSYVNVYQRVNDLYLGDTCCYRCHWHG